MIVVKKPCAGQLIQSINFIKNKNVEAEHMLRTGFTLNKKDILTFSRM